MNTRLVFALLLISACGGDGGKPDVSANKDNVCDQIAAVACYDLYQCCSEGQIENYLGVADPRSESECTNDVRRLCEQQIGIVDASITGGRVTFNASSMNSCLKALLAPDDSCSTVGTSLPWAAACMESAWEGTVAAGGMCSYRFECAGKESYCAANQTCTPLPTDGMACSQAGCATGFYCAGGTCRTQAASGAQCNTNQQCQTGLYCSGGGGGNRTCAPLQGPGQPCTGDQSCKSDQCLPGTCAGNNNTCFTNADCDGRCSNNNQNCQADRDCGNGTCSIGGTTCNQASQCTGAGNTCVFPNTCNLSTCLGNIVCADSQFSADYCLGAVSSLPSPPP